MLLRFSGKYRSSVGLEIQILVQQVWLQSEIWVFPQFLGDASSASDSYGKNLEPEKEVSLGRFGGYFHKGHN